MKMKDFKDALLVTLLRHQRRVGLGNHLEPLGAVEAEGLEYQPGQIGLCIKEFESRGLVNATYFLGGGQDGGIHCYLTAAGVEQAEEIEQTVPEYSRSNRFIRLEDHRVEIERLRDQVVDLQALIRENRDNTFVDKEGTLAELAALELLISRPQISVPLVEKILSETVFFLVRRFSDTAIGAAAGAILTLAAQSLRIVVAH